MMQTIEYGVAETELNQHANLTAVIIGFAI